ncbi:MAG TPA: mevalonate kinase, partial [Candidatus Nitrosotalea sp.]|nr:mevalonate kinase [Candidatus Nitrosotalea sp.]
MKSVASAPGKIILFGEHFVVYGIKAILCSIDKRITATSQFSDDKKIRIRSLLGESEMSIESLNLESVQHKFMKPFFYIAQKAIKENSMEHGIEISIESEIPAGVGLGSSSAACVAVTASVNGLFHKLPKEEVVKIAI